MATMIINYYGKILEFDNKVIFEKAKEINMDLSNFTYDDVADFFTRLHNLNKEHAAAWILSTGKSILEKKIDFVIMPGDTSSDKELNKKWVLYFDFGEN